MTMATTENEAKVKQFWKRFNFFPHEPIIRVIVNTRALFTLARILHELPELSVDSRQLMQYAGWVLYYSDERGVFTLTLNIGG